MQAGMSQCCCYSPWRDKRINSQELASNMVLLFFSNIHVLMLLLEQHFTHKPKSMPHLNLLQLSKKLGTKQTLDQNPCELVPIFSTMPLKFHTWDSSQPPQHHATPTNHGLTQPPSRIEKEKDGRSNSINNRCKTNEINCHKWLKHHPRHT